MSIEAYDYGKKDGIDEACKKIIDWIESNRTGMDFTEDFTLYRDHFQSEDLIVFIKSLQSNEN